MPLERELKYADVDLVALRRALSAGGGDSGGGRYFESNLVFDGPGRPLRSSGVLLRLRLRQGQAVLTVKRPPAVAEASALKVFEELETTVGDFSVMRQALEAVGFEAAFAYEKVREKWLFAGCTVCLDHLPFGDFVEIEGDEMSVPRCAEALGLDPATATRATYHALNLERQGDDGGESDENFVFSSEERAKLLAEIDRE
ncbi:CYTH domain-containing protein [Pseudodesulfovibrio sp. F-1]|uniref:CYTH domain-containing protein n=1 Tax=Pseudodesulfovibrio alkaliphilus TaxID=2661613 RepID=A0A7K1KQF7_9BACT|nr:class IV adenylate cyclase [Pseudodesulfovibrio alkaliphilus]MUM78335.1 CYTH domain-containing protein [Pseudodesulfovibrio alkaliphilus]